MGSQKYKNDVRRNNYLGTMTYVMCREEHFWNVSVVLPSTLMSSEWSLYFRLFNQTFVHFFISPVRSMCLAHFILLYLIILIISGKDYKLWTSSLSPPSRHFFHRISKYSSKHPLLKHNLCFCPNVRAFSPIQNNR
jgi:hypothetical protein